MQARNQIAGFLTAGLLAFSLAGCSDEDGDGAVTDEEIGEIDDAVDDGAEQLEEEVDEGSEEVDG